MFLALETGPGQPERSSPRAGGGVLALSGPRAASGRLGQVRRAGEGPTGRTIWKQIKDARGERDGEHRAHGEGGKGETVQRRGDGDKNRGQEPALTKTETERRRSEIDKGWDSPRGDRDWVGEVPDGKKRVGREPEGVKEHPPFGGSCRPSPPLCLPCSSPSSVTSESPTPALRPGAESSPPVGSQPRGSPSSGPLSAAPSGLTVRPR